MIENNPSRDQSHGRRNGTVIAIAIAAVLAVGVFVVMSRPIEAPTFEKPNSDELADTGDSSFPDISGDPTSRYMLMSFPLAIDPGNAQKVGISDYTWMADVIQVGEAVLTTEQAKEYDELTLDEGYYEVVMADGTTEFYDIDLYTHSFLPDLAYAKAYWTGDFEVAESMKISENDYPVLDKLTAKENRARWVPLENSAELDELKKILSDTGVKNFEIQKADGTTEFYTIRYIEASQERVN